MKAITLFILLILPTIAFGAEKTITAVPDEGIRVYTVPLPITTIGDRPINEVGELQKVKISILVINTGATIRSYWLGIVGGGLTWVPIGFEENWRPLLLLPKQLVPQEKKN